MPIIDPNNKPWQSPAMIKKILQYTFCQTQMTINLRTKWMVLWKKILITFKTQMPLKRHRAYLSSYEDTFTGKEAVDFMMEVVPGIVGPTKSVTRDKCTALLQKVLEENVFSNVRYEIDQKFEDGGTIFKFPPKLNDSNGSRPRSSSVNDASMRVMMRTSQMKATFDPDIRRISNPIDKKDYSSVRHSTLGSRNNFCGSSETGHRSRQGIKLDGGKIETVASPISVLKTCDSSSKIMLSTPGYLKPSARRRSNSVSPILPVEIKAGKIFEPNSWRMCLLSQLRTLLDHKNLSCFLPDWFSDGDINFNCTEVGSNGIVKGYNEKEEIGEHVLGMMRFLVRFPFKTTAFVDANHQYVGIELDTFSNVLVELKKICYQGVFPPNLIYSIQAIFDNFNEDVENGRPKDHGNTLLRRLADKNLPGFLKGGTTSNNITPISGKVGSRPSLRSRGMLRQIPFQTIQDDTHKKFLSSKKQSDNLPGLIRPRDSSNNPMSPLFSPETVTGMESRYLADEAQMKEKLVKILCRFLLLMDSPTRRRLHIIIRFINRVSGNHTLKLSKTYSNRVVILKSITPLLIRCESHSIKPNAKIVAFLMDNESEVFAVPKSLINDHQNYLMDSDFAKNVRSKVNSQLSQMIPNVYSEDIVISSPVQYCQQIKPEEYVAQTVDPESHLIELLDNLLTNSKLDEITRKKKLKLFRRVYPAIFDKRFPTAVPDSPEPQDMPTFVQRIKKMLM
uniref:DEP domain-containing protein n=1 Tax=Rhabditophanes sp. KR3021 TaxID=114890 RepID=A0AC35TFK4_9BILA